MPSFIIDTSILNNDNLKNGQRVIVHSFGDGHVHQGTIRGLISDHITRFYIVCLDPNSPWDHPWDCISVPQGCLSPILEMASGRVH